MLGSGQEGARRMRLLVCEECGSRYYSAAAETLAAEGARCDRCSALLVLAEDDDRVAAVVSPERDRGA
jgi:ribosomal protein S27AE